MQSVNPLEVGMRVTYVHNDDVKDEQGTITRVKTVTIEEDSTNSYSISSQFTAYVAWDVNSQDDDYYEPSQLRVITA